MGMRWTQVQARVLGGLTIAALVGLPGVAQAQTPIAVEETNHTLQYGTYLGGSGHDQHRGVGITSDDKVITAGNFEQLQTLGLRQTTLLGATANMKGKLIKMAADGKTIEAVVTLGDRIDDMELRRDPENYASRDRLVVSGSFGIAVLNPSSMKLVVSIPWPKIPNDTSSASNTIRASIDSQGQVAAIRGKYVALFNHLGAFKASKFIDRDTVADIVMDPLSTRRQLYVVGFANRKNINDGNNPVQVPFLYAFDSFNLGDMWKLWDYDPNTLTTGVNNMADGRLYRVVAGVDGTVAVAGESAGGNSVFRWNGIDLSTPTRMVCDAYDNPYNAKSAHIVYYAKIDANPMAGRVIVGQFAFPRQQAAPGVTGVTNTFRVRDGSLDMDAAGNIYLGGQAFSYLPNRDLNRISGIAPGTYNGNSADMTLLQVSADMKRRIRFMPLAGSAGGGGFTSAIAVKGDRVAIAGTVRVGSVVTGNSLVSTPFNPELEKATTPSDIDDAYLGVLSGMTPSNTLPTRNCKVGG